MAALKKKSNWFGKNGPLLIAEIGGNHEGNFNYAKKLTKLAIKSGADVAKFQIYNGDNLVNKIQSPERYNHFKKFQLSKKEHIYLAEMCIKNGIKYSASVWDLETLEWIDKYLSFYKIGSGDMTCYPIVKHFAKRGKPIILSTGLSNLQEITSFIEFLIKNNKIYKLKENLAILQCTSDYPTADFDANLRVINTYLKNFFFTVGYSDHTLGTCALKTAFVLGASILEFHFTDTRNNKKFRDHKVSLTMKETKKLIKDLNRISILLGSSIKKPTDNEVRSNNIKTFRRAAYFKYDFKKNHKITEKDLIFLRPNNGLDARDVDKVIGKKIKKNVKALDRILFKENI